jgi:hypothetical protein
MSLFSSTRITVDVLGRSRRRGLSRRALLNGRLSPTRLARVPAQSFGDHDARVAAIVAQRRRVAATLRPPQWW